MTANRPYQFGIRKRKLDGCYAVSKESFDALCRMAVLQQQRMDLMREWITYNTQGWEAFLRAHPNAENWFRPGELD